METGQKLSPFRSSISVDKGLAFARFVVSRTTAGLIESGCVSTATCGFAADVGEQNHAGVRDKTAVDRCFSGEKGY